MIWDFPHCHYNVEMPVIIQVIKKKIRSCGLYIELYTFKLIHNSQPLKCWILSGLYCTLWKTVT